MPFLPRAATLLVGYLLLGATGIASAGSIDFTPDPRSPHGDAGIETFYGQLARRQHYRRHGNGHLAAGSAVGVDQSPNNGTSGMVLFGRAEPGEPGMDTYGKLVHVPGCFYCPEEDVRELKGRQLLKSLTTMKMKSYMRARAGDLRNKCVFYTYSLRKPQIPHLSEGASVWACAHNKYSIWHLWPNQPMATESPDRYRDFYGLYKSDNWLNSIDGIRKQPGQTPPPIEYFENMSEAMAQSCEGEVVIMSMSTHDMGRYLTGEPNIWRNKERPVLRALKNQDVVTRFLVVDYDPPNRVYEFDIETNMRGHIIPDSELQSRGLAGVEGLQKRDCTSDGLGSMPPMGDPFADDYSNFE
ncbi:hypothetical protein MAPG_08854 [Magnaporthiopsis poae ATCC 64411]|uniref:Uncharacterized protein n=1 Tax=Magnaporthiopsis poae (strain ATCC 64411 / 73-15) TaxID=644358 RepID=A0A0C4E8F3_MAGP6|nr:hypothetical protein MAPG_08854 [Magnaporthiopsis poae ATCC 64411]